jgi:hypothetical protein
MMIGSWNMHLVRAINASNNVLLEVKEFLCFYHHCIDVVPCDYTSKGYVEPWKLVTLEPCVALDALCDVEYDENDWGVKEDNNDSAAGLKSWKQFYCGGHTKQLWS